MPLQLREVIFCDDIRTEQGHKRSLMGVYTRYLFLPKSTTFPTRMVQLCLFQRWEGVQGGERLYLTVHLDGKKIREFEPVEMKKPSHPSDISQVATHIINFEISAYGEYQFKFGMGSPEKVVGEAFLRIAPVE